MFNQTPNFMGISCLLYRYMYSTYNIFYILALWSIEAPNIWRLIETSLHTPVLESRR